MKVETELGPVDLDDKLVQQLGTRREAMTQEEIERIVRVAMQSEMNVEPRDRVKHRIAVAKVAASTIYVFTGAAARQSGMAAAS